jgi:hypothetical protein
LALTMIGVPSALLDVFTVTGVAVGVARAALPKTAARTEAVAVYHVIRAPITPPFSEGYGLRDGPVSAHLMAAGGARLLASGAMTSSAPLPRVARMARNRVRSGSLKRSLARVIALNDAVEANLARTGANG